MFIPFFSFAQTYKAPESNLRSLGQQYLQGQQQINNIRNRVQNEINDLISDGRANIMGVKIKGGSFYTSNLYFKAQKLALDKLSAGRRNISNGFMSKYELPGYVSQITFDFSQFVFYLERIENIDHNDNYLKSIKYAKDINENFEIILHGVIYNSKYKLEPSEFFQFVYDSQIGKLNNFEKSWVEEKNILEKFNEYRKKIISVRNNFINSLENPKARRIFRNLELEWASKNVGFYWKIRNTNKSLRLITILDELNFSIFNERPESEILDLSDRELIVDYVRFMNIYSTINFSKL